MYEFRDTLKHEGYDLDCLPTSTMFYDKTPLEEYISGYRTLTVEGREMYSLNFETQDKLVGSAITATRYPPRELTIKYLLEDKDADQLQAKFDALLAFLIRKKDVSIRFNDDIGYNFYGRFSGAGNVDGGRNSIVSTFNVFCADPFKYGGPLKSNGLIVTQLPYAVKPEKFTVTMLTSGPLDVTDGNFHLKISSGLNKGDVVIFDFKTGFVKVNGIIRNDLLDLDSDFKNVRLHEYSDFRSGKYDIEILYKKAVL